MIKVAIQCLKPWDCEKTFFETLSCYNHTGCFNVQACRTRCLQTGMKFLEVLEADSIWKALRHMFCLRGCMCVSWSLGWQSSHWMEQPPLQKIISSGLRRRNKQRWCTRRSRCKASNPDMSPNSSIRFLNASKGLSAKTTAFEYI